MKLRYSSYIRITRFLAEFVTLLLFSTVVIVQTLNIFFRYTKICNPWMWVEEFSRYSFIWIVFLLWHLNDRKGTHFVVDVFICKLSGKAKKVIDVFGHCIAFLFAGVVVWASVKYVPITMAYSTDSFRWLPMGVVYSIIPFGLLLVLIEHVLLLIEELRRTKEI